MDTQDILQKHIQSKLTV